MGDQVATRRWAEALVAVVHVPQWLAFRWLAAQAYNAHTPQGPVQEATKVRAGVLAGLLVDGLGGDIATLAPAAMIKDPPWLAYTQAANRLDASQRKALMWIIWRRQFGDDASPALATRQQHTNMQALDLALIDMRRQQHANGPAWLKNKSRPGSA